MYPSSWGSWNSPQSLRSVYKLCKYCLVYQYVSTNWGCIPCKLQPCTKQVQRTRSMQNVCLMKLSIMYVVQYPVRYQDDHKMWINKDLECIICTFVSQVLWYFHQPHTPSQYTIPLLTGVQLNTDLPTLTPSVFIWPSRTARPLHITTDMHRLMTGICSEKCVVRPFHCRANFIQCTLRNPG